MNSSIDCEGRLAEHLSIGHLRFPNRLFEALVEAPFNDVQRRLVMVIARQTIGWGKHTVEISTPELARAVEHEATGSFRSSLSELVVAGVLEQVVRGDGKVRSVYRLEPNFERWGRFAIAPARLAAKWGDRPRHRDDLLAVGARSDGPKTGEKPDGHEGDSADGSPSVVPGGAHNQAPRGAQDQAGGVPAHGQEGCPPAGTPTGPKSRTGSTYEVGKTGNTRELLQQQSAGAREADEGAREQAGAQKQAPSFDVGTMPRWAALAALCETDVERDGMRSFLERRPSAEDAHRWISRLPNWLAGEMVPPAWKGVLTAQILATALDEYVGDGSVRHVQSFVEDVMRRFSGESRSTAATSDVGSKLDTWAAADAAKERKRA